MILVRIPDGIRNLIAVKRSIRIKVGLHHTRSRYRFSLPSLKVCLTLTFLRLHVRQPPRDFRCGFLLTKPVLLRLILTLLQ
jgi:hypothetical protein